MDQKERHTLLCSLTFTLIFCLSFSKYIESQCNRSPVIFNFGDSNSDTGGYSAALGMTFALPYRRNFFDSSSGRLSDGRLMIDFLCESLDTSYLTPYLDSLEPNFSNGANFAISGAATLPRNVPFNLNVQVMQFIQFHARSLELISKGAKDFVGDEGFKNALYLIDIGENDLATAFRSLSYAQVNEKIPSSISEIKDAIWDIYQDGGKNFWVHNTRPLGCFPAHLATASNNDSDFDSHGCLQTHNNAAKVFNTKLSILCEELRSKMDDVMIVYVDTYAITYDLIANSARYGFENPLMACCGYGGPPYNFNPNTICGQDGYNVCKEGSRYISWDGVHYTEAANAFVASKVIFGNYSTPKINFDYFRNTRTNLQLGVCDAHVLV